MTRETRPPGAAEPERYELDEPRAHSFDFGRRAFLGIVGGLVVVVSRTGDAQESGRGGGRGSAPTDLAAWLHVAATGRVTAFTGKVEIGQNTRTSLSQAVADELRVPIDAVDVVMGDTARTPYDAGTFGSQSTPRMAPLLAEAAATARERLVDRAAARWNVDRASLAAADGRVAGGGRVATYGELVADAPLDGAVEASPPLDRPADWRTRGTSVPKVGARAIVTGEHRYPSDVARPGLLHGRVIRPPAPGAALVSLDDRAARAIEGVTVVRDGDFIGVTAPGERALSRAAAAVRVEWRDGGHAVTSETVYDHLRRTGAERAGGGRGGPHVAGDAAAARAGAAKTFDATYRIPYIAHVPLEPRAAVAEWEGGTLTVWTGTQRPFGVRAQLAEAFHLDESSVRVMVPDTGSAYGGKHTGEHAIEAARLSKAAGRPVRLVWTRAEEFVWGYLRPAGVIDVKAAVDASGRLTAWEFDNWNSGGSSIRTPYDVPHQRIAFHPSDSPLRQGSYRGLAATANHYAREMHMDAIARALGRDAVDFRLAHLSNDRMRDVLRAAADRIGWPRAASGRALGIACGTEKGSYVATAAELSRTADGFAVERLVVAFECGAIVNPEGLRHQVEGAVIQGLGGALFEEIAFAGGRLLNGTMAKYRVPRFTDVPPIDVVLLDRRDLPSEGAGETPIVGVAPAIGSAARAFGRVATALPVRLEPDADSAGP